MIVKKLLRGFPLANAVRVLASLIDFFLSNVMARFFINFKYSFYEFLNPNIRPGYEKIILTAQSKK